MYWSPAARTASLSVLLPLSLTLSALGGSQACPRTKCEKDTAYRTGRWRKRNNPQIPQSCAPRNKKISCVHVNSICPTANRKRFLFFYFKKSLHFKRESDGANIICWLLDMDISSWNGTDDVYRTTSLSIWNYVVEPLDANSSQSLMSGMLWTMQGRLIPSSGGQQGFSKPLCFWQSRLVQSYGFSSLFYFFFLFFALFVFFLLFVVSLCCVPSLFQYVHDWYKGLYFWRRL